MRLAKVAVASISPTVGAVRANVSRMIALAREMAEADVTIAAFPEQVIGGYPPEDLVQWRGFVDAQWRELERFAARDRRLGNGLRPRADRRASADSSSTAAAIVHRGRCARLRAEGKAPDLQRLLRGAHVLARRRPSLRSTRPASRSATTSSASTSASSPSRCARTSGRPTARCAAAATPAPSSSSTSRRRRIRLGVVRTRREMIATRAADNQTVLIYANLVGGKDGLIFDGGGFVFQNGRLVLEAPRFREGWALRRSSISTAPAACATRTPPGAPTARTSGCSDSTSRVLACAGPHGGSIATRLSGAADGGSFFLPAVATAPVDPRDAALDDLLDALALGRRRLLREDRRLQARSASRSPVAATRCSRCSSRGAPRR